MERVPEELSDHERKALIRQYAEEIGERSKIPFIEPLRAWNTVAVRWSVAAVVVLATCALQAHWLLASPEAQAPRPTAAVLAIEADDSCATRQAAIVRALATFTRQQGRPPKSLDLLDAPYLNEDPVDPVSGRPYKYQYENGALTVACPNPRLHVHEGP